jgi:PAS domain S-box-containing protein
VVNQNTKSSDLLITNLRLQLENEKLITAILAKFFNLPTDQIDIGINEVCKIIGTITQASRSFFLLINDRNGVVDRTYEWCSDGIAPFPDRCSSAFIISLLASKKTDGTVLRSEENGATEPSSMAVALTSNGILRGIIGIEAVSSGLEWPPDSDSLLAMTGKMIMNTFSRKRTEDLISREQNLLTILMDSIPDTNIYFKDIESRFTHMNKTQAELMGLSDPAIAIGKSDLDFFENAHMFIADEQRIITTGQGLIGKAEKVAKADGSFHWFSSTKMPIRDPQGAIIGTFGISRDITRLKEYEDELQKAKEQLEIRVAERTTDLTKTNEQLESHIKQLDFLYSASFELSKTMTFDALHPVILALFLKRFPSSQGAICQIVGKKFVCLHATGIYNSDAGKSFCSHVCTALHASGLPTLFIEEKLNNDALLRNYPLPGVSGFSSYIAIPLNIEATCIAIVQIFMPEYQYNKRENALLITLAAHAAICLSNAMGLEKLKEKARLDGELKAARLIQYRYTPHHTPPIPRITLKGVYLPAYEVGGDYLDYFQTEKGNWVIIIADICGKGIPAALMMTMLRSTFRIESKYVDSAKDLLCAVNNFFSQNLDDSSFATASCLVINNDGTRMKYARAGHLNLIHFDKSESKLKTISARGIALGLVSEAINYSATIDEIDIPLQTGDKFLLYTDGLTDTMDSAKREYGYNRLNDVLFRNKNADAEALVSSLMKDIKEFASGEPPRDDLTILALEVTDGKSSDLQ